MNANHENINKTKNKKSETMKKIEQKEKATTETESKIILLQKHSEKTDTTESFDYYEIYGQQPKTNQIDHRSIKNEQESEVTKKVFCEKPLEIEENEGEKKKEIFDKITLSEEDNKKCIKTDKMSFLDANNHKQIPTSEMNFESFETSFQVKQEANLISTPRIENVESKIIKEGHHAFVSHDNIDVGSLESKEKVKNGQNKVDLTKSIKKYEVERTTGSQELLDLDLSEISSNEKELTDIPINLKQFYIDNKDNLLSGIENMLEQSDYIQQIEKKVSFANQDICEDQKSPEFSDTDLSSQTFFTFNYRRINFKNNKWNVISRQKN